MKADVADSPLKKKEKTRGKRLFILLSHTFKLICTDFIGERHTIQERGGVE